MRWGEKDLCLSLDVSTWYVKFYCNFCIIGEICCMHDENGEVSAKLMLFNCPVDLTSYCKLSSEYLGETCLHSCCIPIRTAS